LPFQFDVGIQTSILMSESLVGFKVAVTRQKAGNVPYGDAAPARPVAPGGVNAPGETVAADVTVPPLIGNALRDSHGPGAATAATVGAPSPASSRELTATMTAHATPPASRRAVFTPEEEMVLMPRESTTTHGD